MEPNEEKQQVLRTENLIKRYGKRTVVNEVSLISRLIDLLLTVMKS